MGDPCTKLWHTAPVAVRRATAYASYGYAKRANPLKQDYTDSMLADAEDVARSLDDGGSQVGFPDWGSLWVAAWKWVYDHGGAATNGPIAAVWLNESLTNRECPARITFERAASTAKLTSWQDGEFGWHGTGSIKAIEGICWENFDTERRAGQVFGPGEYFSRGTEAGLHYSEMWSGGDAANMLIVSWIMSARLGATPDDSNTCCGDAAATGHIVCKNPVEALSEGDNRSTGEMYCVPVAVVAFGQVHAEYGISGRPKFHLLDLGYLWKRMLINLVLAQDPLLMRLMLMNGAIHCW